MSYTVFARKYRPQTFDDVIGQDHITRTLKNAIELNRLAHAYIFVGPRGTGKTSTARILAKALNCQKFPAPTVTPCGTCDSCLEITSGNSLDVLEFDAASNTQVDKVRELIIENVKYAPTRGRYKMYIVDEVHMLSTSSFNALLKTLEEPPAHVKFAFATTDVQKVPSTILSRCQRFDLKRIAPALISAHLGMIAGKEGIVLAPAAAESVARGAEGGMRDAESMLDQLVAFCGDRIEEEDVLTVFGFTSQETITSLCDHLLDGMAAPALAVLHEQAEAGRDLGRLLADLIAHCRNLLVAQTDPQALAGEQTEEAIAAISAQAQRVSAEKLLELVEQFAGAETRMKWASNKKMHFEIAVIRAIQTLGQATLTEVLDNLAALRDGKPVAARPAPPPRAPTAPPASKPAKVAPSATTHAPRVAARPVPVPAPEPPQVFDVSPPEPSPVVAETPPDAPAPAAAPVESGELWTRLLTEVRARRPLILGLVQAGTLLDIEGAVANVAFPPQEKLARDMCEGGHRKFLEDLLSELAGTSYTMRCSVREGLVVVAPELPPAPKPAAPRDAMEEFKDDPLIRRALEIFQAELQPALL